MELRGVLRVRDPAWNPEKMGFFLEARGNMQHQFMEKGQATVQNALRVAEKSAFDLFLSQLQQDQSFFRAHLFYISLHDAQCVCVWRMVPEKLSLQQPRELLRTSGDSERKRQAAVSMLEAGR